MGQTSSVSTLPQPPRQVAAAQNVPPSSEKTTKEQEFQRKVAIGKLKEGADPKQIAEALKGKNSAIGAMGEIEQRALINTALGVWDRQHNPAAAATLKNDVKDNATLSSVVNSEYQRYGSDNLANIYKSDRGEFKNRLADGKDKSFVGGCLATPNTCDAPPINKKGEAIVVSGQNGQSHSIKDHFLSNGFARANEQRQMGKDTTWIVYSGEGADGYSKELLDAYGEKAKAAGINFKVVSDTKDIVGYLNDKGGEGDPRSNKPISDLIYTGHGLPGKWEVDYSAKNPHHGVDISKIKNEVFAPNAFVNFNASCRTANGDRSVMEQFAYKLIDSGDGGIVSATGPGDTWGSAGRTCYGGPEVDTDAELLDSSRCTRRPFRWFDNRKSERYSIEVERRTPETTQDANK